MFDAASPSATRPESSSSGHGNPPFKPLHKSDDGTGDAPGANRGVPLPCLLVTTQSRVTGQKSKLARRAEGLFQNLDALIDRVGLEKCGLFTSTFSDNCDRREESEKRFNSYATNILRDLFPEYIAVPERQNRGAFHHHLAVACAVDIRTGFDFEACSAASEIKRAGYRNGAWLPGFFEKFKRMERLYIASANPHLKAIWRAVRESAPKYKFGRCELLPILSNAQACARYMGAYVSSQHYGRAREDKGLRTVRYALEHRPWSSQWNFVKGGHSFWRRGCCAYATLLNIDDFSLFGPRWAFHLADSIFLASDHFEKCMKFASTLPSDMGLQARQMPVARFLSSLRHLTPLPSPNAQGGDFRESGSKEAEHQTIHQNPVLNAP